VIDGARDALNAVAFDILGACVVGLRSWRADLGTPTAVGEPALVAAGVAMVRP
jgi:hypothetical protein